MKELSPSKYSLIQSLVRGFEYSLSLRAAIQGLSPGRIFVDNEESPRTMLALTVEGYLLGGDDSDPAVINSLRDFLKEKIFSGEIYINGDASMSLAVHPQTWENRLPELIPTHEVEKLDRYHYLCHALKLDWRTNLPDGYQIHRVDREILSGDSYIFSEGVRGWMDIEEIWGDQDNFLDQGMSYVAELDGVIVSWCTPDCAAGEQIDIGIYTDPEHRQRGLAASVVAATVEGCFTHGYKNIGWHCNVDNIPSWKTAEKVGFVRNREYAYYYYMYDPIDHLAELGWYHYRKGQFSRTITYYEQVFSQRNENPDYYYHLTASACAKIKDRECAIKYLRAAMENGWKHIEWTKQQDEFINLLQDEDWQKIIY